RPRSAPAGRCGARARGSGRRTPPGSAAASARPAAPPGRRAGRPAPRTGPWSGSRSRSAGASSAAARKRSTGAVTGRRLHLLSREQVGSAPAVSGTRSRSRVPSPTGVRSPTSKCWRKRKAGHQHRRALPRPALNHHPLTPATDPPAGWSASVLGLGGRVEGAEADLGELGGGDGGGGAGEGVGAGLGLGEGDDLADGGGAGQEHVEAVEAEGEAAVRGGAEGEALEEEPEAVL